MEAQKPTGLDGSAPQCPHCDAVMQKLTTPPMTNWESPFIWVCFNDDCDYFQRGWDWMISQYNVQSSYRYKVDPVTGEHGPLPVWSDTALKSNIIEEGQEAES